MASQNSLFNPRVLKNFIAKARWEGVTLPDEAGTIICGWADKLARGVIDKFNEGQVEQTFNQQIFCRFLGYRQLGEASEATIVPKVTGPRGRDTPDFVLGRFDAAANIDRWAVVGEVKSSLTDLDQPQIQRTNKETPVEQAFRYAIHGKPGVEWIIVSNFKEVRLYKNGYSGAFHRWYIQDLIDENKLYEFFAVLRPESLVDFGSVPFTTRLFRESVAAGRLLTEGFYALYKQAQAELLKTLAPQQASVQLSEAELYGKTHRLLNRILFAAFCEDHPAELLPRGTLQALRESAQRNLKEDSLWDTYKKFFALLNVGGQSGDLALNAFNGGLFAHDPYFDAVIIPNQLFNLRLQTGKGQRRSPEITGVFGFHVYDFADDLNAQALGAIFEQSLKDIIKGPKLVRGFGEIDFSTQRAGGVFYTPPEVTAYMIRRALGVSLDEIHSLARERLADTQARSEKVNVRGRRVAAGKKKEAYFYDAVSALLSKLKILDPSCGSGAFLVEALEQLRSTFEKTNRAVTELTGHVQRQMPLFQLDRQILRNNLHGRDILQESIEITRLSLWLRTASKGEKLEVLDKTITASDTLRDNSLSQYDIVIGNPPWGAELEGWSNSDLTIRFPECGEEKDSYAVLLFALGRFYAREGF